MEDAFDQDRTLEGLSKLQPHQQLAFGAACCERMLPGYETFQREANWGDIGPLRRTLNAIWEACAGTPPGPAAIRVMLSQCESCAPDADDFTVLHTAAAEDAVFAICALLDFLLDADIAQIVSAPRFATDTVDLIVQEQEDMDSRDPLREQKILEHPLMQQELVRQRRDLTEAAHLTLGDGVALLAFRARAQREPNLVLAP